MKRLATIALLLISAATALAGSKQYYSYPAAGTLKDTDKILVYQNASGSRNLTWGTLRNTAMANAVPLSTAGEINVNAEGGIYLTAIDKVGITNTGAGGVAISTGATPVDRITVSPTGDINLFGPLIRTQPAEITNTELLRQNWGTTGEAPFQLHTMSWPNSREGTGTYDHGVHMGFNVGRHSTATPTANKPSLIMGFEDNYFSLPSEDNNYGMEWYIEYFRPDGTYGSRPMYTRILSYNNTVNAVNTWFDIGTDATYSQYTVKSAIDNILTIKPSSVAVAKPATFTDTTESTSAVSASVILKGGLWSDKKIIGLGGITSGSSLMATGAHTYNTTSDRMAAGILGALPTSSTGAYMGWASGISGTLTGDMLLIPRTDVGGSLRVYTGSGTPVERLTVDASGNTRMGSSTNNATVQSDGTLAFSGTGKLPYGSMYVEEAALTTSVALAHTYYPVTSGLLGGTSSGFTFQNGSELKCLVAGKYLVNWSMSLSSNQGDTTIEGAVMVNSTGAIQTANATKAKEATQVYSVGGTGILTLAVNDLVKLSVERVDGIAATLTINHANLTLVHIGG